MYLTFFIYIIHIYVILIFGKGDILKKKDSLILLQKREWCKGCGICVEFCPTNVLVIDNDQKVTIDNLSACIKCRQCELRCPDFAIFLEEKSDE